MSGQPSEREWARFGRSSRVELFDDLPSTNLDGFPDGGMGLGVIEKQILCKLASPQPYRSAARIHLVFQMLTSFLGLPIWRIRTDAAVQASAPFADRPPLRSSSVG